jgi:hypothetical protein
MIATTVLARPARGRPLRGMRSGDGTRAPFPGRASMITGEGVDQLERLARNLREAAAKGHGA